MCLILYANLRWKRIFESSQYRLSQKLYKHSVTLSVEFKHTTLYRATSWIDPIGDASSPRLKSNGPAVHDQNNI